MTDDEKLKETLALYKSSTKGQVQFQEVDSGGVVHNVKYLFWLEWARAEYLRGLGISYTAEMFTKDYPLRVVHAGIDYFYPLQFGDKYEVFSRVFFVKNSSLGFENIVMDTKGNTVLFAKAILVYFDTELNLPTRIPEHLRQLIKDFEGENVQFID
ncbi:MAG: thioesterase family protein [Bacteroidota bacterium]